jgi:hypothetical protein
VDLLIALAACRFVADRRRLGMAQVLAGEARHHAGSRALAMALAHTVGRASSETVARLYGCSRQNVDNASERFLRARDGDDPDDFVDGAAKVIERGRLRRAKVADQALWALERDFAAIIAGEPAERKRA